MDTEAPSCTLTRCNQALEKQVKCIHVGFAVSPDQPQSGAKHAAVMAWHPGFFPCLQRLPWLRRGAVALGCSMLTQEQAPRLPRPGTGAPGAVLDLSCVPRFWAGWYKAFTVTDCWLSSVSVILSFLFSLLSCHPSTFLCSRFPCCPVWVSLLLHLCVKCPTEAGSRWPQAVDWPLGITPLQRAGSWSPRRAAVQGLSASVGHPHRILLILYKMFAKARNCQEL